MNMNWFIWKESIQRNQFDQKDQIKLKSHLKLVLQSKFPQIKFRIKLDLSFKKNDFLI